MTDTTPAPDGMTPEARPNTATAKTAKGNTPPDSVWVTLHDMDPDDEKAWLDGVSLTPWEEDYDAPITEWADNLEYVRRDLLEALAADLARQTARADALALAICGGEDVPGYAAAQPVEALEKVARDSANDALHLIDQLTAAEAKVARLVEAATWAMNHVSKLPMDEATQSEFMRHRAALTTETDNG